MALGLRARAVAGDALSGGRDGPRLECGRSRGRAAPQLRPLAGSARVLLAARNGRRGRWPEGARRDVQPVGLRARAPASRVLPLDSSLAPSLEGHPVLVACRRDARYVRLLRYSYM